MWQYVCMYYYTWCDILPNCESVWLHCYCWVGPSRRAVIPGWGTRHFLPRGTGGSRSIVLPPASLYPCQVQSGWCGAAQVDAAQDSGVRHSWGLLHTGKETFKENTEYACLFLAPERDIIFISLCRKQFSPLFQELMLNLSPQALFSQLLKKEEFVTNLPWKL